MLPGQLHPNELECALLERLALEHPEAQLSVPNLQMLSRRFTAVGSISEFLVKGKPPAVLRRVLSLSTLITIPGLRDGLGAVAFREGDRLKLETYTFGNEKWDGTFEGFEFS
jgi:hypothetical protein